jgi:uncharacterized surface protein with fasciclin (FAS1) repeats
MRQLLLLAGFVLAFISGAFAQTKKPTTSNATKTVVEIASNSPDHSTLVGAIKAAGLTETLKGKGPFTVFAPTNKAFEKLMEDEASRMKTTPMNEDTMNRMNPTPQDTSTWNRNNPNPLDTSMNRMNPTQRDTNTWNQTNQNPTLRDTVPPRTSETRTQAGRDTVNNTWLQSENRAELTDILNYHVVRGNFDSNALKQAIKAGNGKAELTTVNGAKLTATLQGTTIQIEDVAGNRAQVTTSDLKGSNGVIHVIDKVVMPGDEDRNKK